MPVAELTIHAPDWLAALDLTHRLPQSRVAAHDRTVDGTSVQMITTASELPSVLQSIEQWCHTYGLDRVGLSLDGREYVLAGSDASGLRYGPLADLYAE